MKYEHTMEGWLALCRGKPAYKVAQVLNCYSQGINWTGCNKGRMARAWIDSAGYLYSNSILKLVAAIERILAAPNAAERRARKEKKAFNVRVHRAMHYLQYNDTGSIEYRANAVAAKSTEVLLACRMVLDTRRIAMKEKIIHLEKQQACLQQLVEAIDAAHATERNDDDE